MKRAMGLLLLMMTGACATKVITAPVPAATPEAPRIGLTVSGTATMEVVPDTADLRMTLTAEAARPGAAAKAVRERQAEVQKQVAAIEGAKIDVALSFLSVTPVYDEKTYRVRGYRAAISLTLSTGEFDRMAELMEIGAVQNATEMSASFRTKDLTGLKAKVRDQALAAVKSKAKQMSDGLGVKLGKIVVVNEDFAGSWSGYLGAAVPNAQTFMPSDSSEVLRPDAQPLTLTVTVGYELAGA